MQVRSLGQYGIVRDVTPYDLPINAWSGGNNVSFAEGKAKRAPALRVIDGMTPTKPAFLMSAKQANGTTFLVYPDDTGVLYKWLGGTETNVTEPTFTPASSTEPFTGCVLSGVAYINRAGSVPYGYRSSDATFVEIPAWDSAHMAKVLRKYKDFLIALNLTKSGTEFPRLFKSSHFALNDSFPDSFDATDPTKLAYETEITQIDGPIVDGMALRQSFVIYGETQCALVNFTGGSTVYDIKPLFEDKSGGVINANCVVEVNGQHYVFGRSDIYTHDGVQKTSIIAGRNQDFVFKNLDRGKTHRFFVFHNEQNNTVNFCYVSVDDDVFFTGSSGCNKIASYNYINGTWAFSDAPSIHGAASVNVQQVLTWATVNSTWATIGGNWAQQGSAKFDAVVVASQQETELGLDEAKIAAFDRVDDKSILPFDIYTEANPPAWLERTGLDLEELGDGDLAAYKLINRLLPQAKTFGDAPLIFKTGRQMTPDGDLEWSEARNFASKTQYKVDVRKGGRYLALRVEMPTVNDFEFSGYDADAGSMSRR